MATASILTAARRGLALLPVRFDDRAFWPRAAVGLVLRAWALAGAWIGLRRALTEVVAAVYPAFGGRVQVVGETLLLADQHMVDITVSCTQIEVVALLLPLAWNLRRPVRHELAVAGGLLAAAGLLAVGRLVLALGLYRLGFDWSVAHDVPLGITYALLFIVVLRRNAWAERVDATCAEPEVCS